MEYKEKTRGHASHFTKNIMNVKFVNDTEVLMVIDKKKGEETMPQKTLVDEVPIEDEEEQYVRNDPIRKLQFDHNISTCLTNKYPEMLIDDDGEDINKHEDFSFAPGEGKTHKIS